MTIARTETINESIDETRETFSLVKTGAYKTNDYFKRLPETVPKRYRILEAYIHDIVKLKGEYPEFMRY